MKRTWYEEEIEEERITSKSSMKKGGQRGGLADNNCRRILAI